MKSYRVQFGVDIDALDEEEAVRRTRVLYAVLVQRYWVQAARHSRPEERPRPVDPPGSNK